MSDDAPTPTPDEAPAASTPDKAPTASAPDETSPTPTPPTMRRICCVAAPRRAPSLADQLRAASVWAQILQGAEAARGRGQETPDGER